MKFMVLIYNDSSMLDGLSSEQFDTTMRGCLQHADDLRKDGRLLDSQMLDSATKAKSVRSRNDRLSIMDGPFAESKEVLAGFNVIEAENMDEAVKMAAEFPWTRTGCIEVRPIIDINAVRERVGAV
ncbi:MAG TPA: YciI family protein [Gemmatimonadaceae bacterium]|nr:YciI family protein [Gemmatimonadaceae bacterium]